MTVNIKFSKFHGFGNDYIVIERRDVPAGLTLAALARAICARHTGAGADGIAVIEPLTAGRYFCEIVNPDGTTAGFSGNGTRCAAAFLHHSAIHTAPTLELETRSGKKHFELLAKSSGGRYKFSAEIGKPQFSSGSIPINLATPADTVIDYAIGARGRDLPISAINVGNPVACIFVNEFPDDWQAIAAPLEIDEAFPERANIVFVKIVDRSTANIRIWERGAGETAASGTCAAGAAVLSAFTHRTGRIVDIISHGGTTRVEWRRQDGEMLITGDAEFVYSGEFAAPSA